MALHMYVDDNKSYPYYRTLLGEYVHWPFMLKPYQKLSWETPAYHCPAYQGAISPTSNAPVFILPLLCKRPVEVGDRHFKSRVFQQIGQLGADFRALDNGPALAAVADRLQRCQRVRDARPRQARADLGGALHL